MQRSFGRTKIDISYGSFRILRTGCKNVPIGSEYALIQIAKGRRSSLDNRYGIMSNQWAYLYIFGLGFFIRIRNFYK